MRPILAQLLRQPYRFLKNFFSDPDLRQWCKACLLYYRKPRFEVFDFNLSGQTLRAVDAASLLSMLQDIYVKKVYDFDFKSDQPLIVDAGANIGLASIRWCEHFPKARLIAIEADPAIGQVYKHNIQQAGFSDRVTLHNSAAWINDGHLQFNREGADGGRIAQKEASLASSIPCLDLSRLLKELPHIDFLKLDIEGAENLVFPHIAEQLSKVDRLFLEYHESENEAPFLAQILEILEKKGFRYLIEPQAPIERPFSRLVQTTTKKEYLNQINIWAFRHG